MAAGMQSFGQCTTPGRPKRERRRVPSRKQLFPVPEPVAKFVDTWTKEENKALVEYVLFHGEPNVWPSHSKGSKFWQLAAEFVQQRSGASTKRTGELYHKFYSSLPQKFNLSMHASSYLCAWKGFGSRKCDDVHTFIPTMLIHSLVTQSNPHVLTCLQAWCISL